MAVTGLLGGSPVRLVEVSPQETTGERLRQRVETLAGHPVKGVLCDGKPLPLHATLTGAGVTGFRFLTAWGSGLLGGMQDDAPSTLST